MHCISVSGTKTAYLYCKRNKTKQIAGNCSASCDNWQHFPQPVLLANSHWCTLDCKFLKNSNQQGILKQNPQFPLFILIFFCLLEKSGPSWTKPVLRGLPSSFKGKTQISLDLFNQHFASFTHSQIQAKIAEYIKEYLFYQKKKDNVGDNNTGFWDNLLITKHVHWFVIATSESWYPQPVSVKNMWASQHLQC